MDGLCKTDTLNIKNTSLLLVDFFKIIIANRNINKTFKYVQLDNDSLLIVIRSFKN